MIKNKKIKKSNSIPLSLYPSIPIKILVTGGGTGGHVKPLMAVTEELQNSNCNLLYVGSGIEIEKEEAIKHKIHYQSVLAGKFRRYFSWQNFIDIFKVMIGFLQSIFIILFFKPNVVFAKGGYVTVPVAYAAWILRKPIIVHETDVVLGLANRLIFNKCQKLCVGFPVKYYQDLSIEKVVYTGNPIEKLKTKIEKRKTTVQNSKLTILITGGSQGSRFINQVIAAILPQLTGKYNIIHICGKLDYQWLSKNKWDNYRLYDYTDQFMELMSQANLVISRAGGTIMEIAALAKPAIIIPLPSAASNHQEANAKVIEENNAAIVLREKSLTPENLLEIIDRTMEDQKLRQDLSKQISQFSQPDAARMIVKEILNYTPK